MSHRSWLLPIALFAPLLAHAAPAPDSQACEVWQRELSFARSVQRHDAKAFVAHIADDAVFDANTGKPTRGATTIAQHWAAIIAGRDVHLDWYPKQVVVTGDGTLAYSSGAYLFEDPAPNAKQRYTIGAFATVWRRGGDGVWRVAFDGGDQGKPASDADVAAFRGDRQARCPASEKTG